MKKVLSIFSFSSVFLFLSSICAAQTTGMPEPWQFGLQEMATPFGAKLSLFYEILLYTVLAIAIFVLVLLFYTCYRFRASANPTPSSLTHNTLLEVVWTLIPVVIVIAVSVYSVPLIYEQEDVSDADLTINVTGYQWYWGYEYPDHDSLSFDSYMIRDEDLSSSDKRLLSVDEPIVIPSDTKVRFLITAADVLHAWAVPAFGVKMDAIPGQSNEIWVRVDARYEGSTFYGQCSELCGVDHARMPIAVRVVSKDEFDSWIREKNSLSASLPASSPVS